MFEKLKSRVIEESRLDMEKSLAEAKKEENVTSEYGNDFLTTNRKIQLRQGFITIEKAYEIMQRKFEKNLAKRIAGIEEKFIAIENAPEFEGGTVETEWRKSSVWGSNPASKFRTNDGLFMGAPVSGCGYDKASASVAGVLNQSMSLRKVLYSMKEADVEKSNEELFGYGSGYGTLPYFEGGVGVNCYPHIFEAMSYRFVTVASGKTYDVYRISKKD